MDIKILKDMFLTIERGNLLKRQDQTIYKRIMVYPGLLKSGNVKGMYPAPDIHEHFTIHKWLRQTAYIFTHNFNNLEHIANNCMSAMTHTDVTTAQPLSTMRGV